MIQRQRIGLMPSICSTGRSHNHTSPNKKDMATRRHPDHPAQKQGQTAVRIYQYETWDQLWQEFRKENKGIADNISNLNQLNECPMPLCKFAPWEMIKGKDSSCRCINCEGTNAVKRGAKAEIKAIDPIKSNIDLTANDTLASSGNGDNGDNDSSNSDTDNNNDSSNSDADDNDLAGNDSVATSSKANESEDDNDKRAVAKLMRVYDILSMETKYDICVACLFAVPSKWKA
jgi:hypothetical protein